MEERRTAAWVLGILAIIVIFFTVVRPNTRYWGTQTLTFKTCTVKFTYNIKGLEGDTYRANQNRLALCLCDVYQGNHDTSISNKIIKIYKEYDRSNDYDSVIVKRNYSLDSIIKYKAEIFDTRILID